jgi:hypothetical protein
MKKKTVVLSILLCFALTACAGTQTIQTQTETMVVTVETIGTLAFPMAKAFILQKEANGSWDATTAAQAKKYYNRAADDFIKVIDAVKASISGKSTPLTNLPVLLTGIAQLLANATGGTIDRNANTLTLPKAGGGQ